MGNRLVPITDKSVEEGSTEVLQYAAVGMQGRRNTMEDQHLFQADVLPGHNLFAVFDGHGGVWAAKFAAQHLPRILVNALERYNAERQKRLDNIAADPSTKQCASKKEKKLLQEAFQEAFLELDRQFYLARLQRLERLETMAKEQKRKKVPELKDSGSTVVAVLLTPDCMVCANAGDSRAVLLQGPKTFVPLSEDHRPNVRGEESRINAAGGFVFGGRLEDDLAVSRGMGDYRFKEDHLTIHGTCAKSKRSQHDQKVSPFPDVHIQNRHHTRDRYILLACDGIFERLVTEKVVRQLEYTLDRDPADLKTACSELLDKSLKKGSKDNMTALLVKLKSVNPDVEYLS